MIKITETEVFGWKTAIRGMRNPMESWDKSDSGWSYDNFGLGEEREYIVGENDLALMKKLVNAGSDHSKFMRMIVVSCDITAPLYWWKEYDTYKVGTVANSCSTMHKIQAKDFTMDDFSFEHIGEGIATNVFNECAEQIVDCLNEARLCFLDDKNKAWWWQMIQLLPTTYNQLRTVQLNYAVLRNMYHARKNHKLDEWHEFCAWVETLPYSELITEGGNE